jgi:LytS/YehU family sensor histidine kinase
VLHVYSDKSERPFASMDIPEKTSLFRISFGHFEGRNILVISSFNRTQFVEIILNPWHQYRYMFWAVIFIALLAFFLLLQLVFNYQMRKQQALKEELIKGQLAISKKQLEPHFMLNMLNNIGALFAKEDTRQGQYYFGKYASLLHRGLKYADQVETTLQEELDFIEDYMVLQKMRFDGELEYAIEIEEGVYPELINIPHSLLYTFVENAIKHGLAPKETDRKLEINVTTAGKHLEISIRDNGIGRQKAAELGTSGTGKGLIIINEIVKSYNRLYSKHIQYKITTLHNENTKGSGTKVSIIL